MFDDVVGAYGSRFLLAAGGVGIALICLIGVLWILRNRAPSPFVRGGRNRQPRLQVLDAAAVDARRRLVLVRRDDVEHLIMIGGPTDIVIESRILPEAEEEPQRAFQPRAVEDRPVAAIRPEPPAPTPAPRPTVAPVRATEPAPVPAESRMRPEPPVVVSPAPSAPVMAEREVPRAAQPVPPRPVERPVPSSTATTAADILDAARQRVLPQQSQRIEPQVITPPAQNIPVAPAITPAAAEAATPAQAPGAAPRGDFQRVLDQEMTGNLTAERLVPMPNPAPTRASTPQPQPPLQPGNMPRRDPEMAPITGADAALQNEVARIFGEMSVNRDK
jgi:hypothetical protein